MKLYRYKLFRFLSLWWSTHESEEMANRELKSWLARKLITAEEIKWWEDRQ